MKHLAAVILSFFLLSCSPLAKQARQVVKEADRLYAQGIMYDDSLRLAKAAKSLNKTFMPTSYAKANYYYGRLLRQKGCQVEAMQCFINASSAHTHDYYLLGLVYSGMGSMFHLANEFSLSYDMFAKSAELFKKAKNQTSYYYALNDMAFELVEQDKIDEAFSVLHEIETNCTSTDVITLTLGTKTCLYKKIQQYDTAISIANEAILHDPNYPMLYVIKAQSFWFLEQYDSALNVAQQVMNMPNCSPQDKYNMLYILTYNDSTLNAEDVKMLSEERADIDKDTLDPLHKQLAQAIQVYNQSIKNQSFHQWMILVYFLCFPLVIIAILLIIKSIKLYVHTKQEHIEAQEHIEQAKRETEAEINKQQILQAEQQHLQVKNQHLLTEYTQNRNKKLEQIEKDCAALRIMPTVKFKEEISWNNRTVMSDYMNKHYYFLATKVQRHAQLNDTEFHLCMLIFIGFQLKQIAYILPYAANSVGKLKYTTAKKLSTTGKNLRRFLIDMAIGDELTASDDKNSHIV